MDHFNDGFDSQVDLKRIVLFLSDSINEIFICFSSILGKDSGNIVRYSKTLRNNISNIQQAWTWSNREVSIKEPLLGVQRL